MILGDTLFYLKCISKCSSSIIKYQSFSYENILKFVQVVIFHTWKVLY